MAGIAMYEEWPLLEFTDVRKGILSRFSADASDNVAHLLIRELVEALDKPQISKISNEQELEWMMQIVNHAFSLSFASQRDYETIHSAVRIYMTWTTALTVNVHPACPQPLRDHPDRYFRRMLEAMRFVFVPRDASDVENVGIKQAAEMKTILTSLRSLSVQILDEYKDECWSKLILFLLAVNSQMLDDPNVIDEYHNHISAELLGTLFDCWTTASLMEFIPSPSYWKTFTHLSRKWTPHMPLIEQWGKKVLPLGALIIQNVMRQAAYGLQIQDEKLLKLNKNKQLSDTWFRLFHLVGSPVKILAAEIPGHREQYSLSFFLAVLVYSRLVDVFYGDDKVSVDFHESEEVVKSWVGSCKELQEEWNRSYHQQRTSNMSAASVNTDSGTGSSIQNIPLASSNSVSRKHALSIPANRQTTQRSSGRSGTNLNTVKEPLSAPIVLEEPHFPDLPKPKLGQYVYHYLKSNKFRKLEKAKNQTRHLSTSSMLEVFLQFLGDAALQSPQMRKVQEDAISQRSMSSVDFDTIPGNGEKVTRRSFAQSTASSSDYSLMPHTTSTSGVSSTLDMPQMDSIAAGRAAALGALCRIVCEKCSNEELSTDHLAHFYLIMHKALVERDRLSLCSIVYYGTELFNLGLKGVEILLPNYLMAIDIVLTESMKVRLHPSVQEVEMRHTCLQTLASIVSWPTTFSAASITDDASFTKSAPGTAGTNMLEQRPTYLELRQRMLKCLVHTLRNETDSTNLHLALCTCAVFCLESCQHDLETLLLKKKPSLSDEEGEDEERCFAVSALRSVVSAVCDNICKPQWTNELATSLAALDCLNALASLPTEILFFNDEMSTGSLIVASLCRFTDVQLRKPPMYHSRDLHSSVVAAYSALGVWLTTAPKLAEIESCLATVSEAIEFGLTGGKDLKPLEVKPASMRVRDAADNLMNLLLSFKEDSDEVVDERRLLYKYGPQSVDTTRFKHFLLNQSVIVSIHEASHIVDVAGGLPTVIVVTRTPYSAANASVFQMKPSLLEGNESSSQMTDNSPVTTAQEFAETLRQPLKRMSNDGRLSIDSTFGTENIQQFEFPAGFDKPLCKLDAAFPAVETTAEASKIIGQLGVIQNRLQQGGGGASGQRDSQNVWIQSSLGALLTQQLKPQGPACKVNSMRNFLYDIGLINENSFDAVLQPLDSGNAEQFYKDLHAFVDQTPVRITQTVGLFYVRDGQTDVGEILENALYLDETCPEFCKLLSELGDAVDVAAHPHWTGHWDTAFSSERKPIEPIQNEKYTFDGVSHCLWWADNLLELAFVMYSENSLQSKDAVNAAGDMKKMYSSPRGSDAVPETLIDNESASVSSVRSNSPSDSSSQQHSSSRKSDVSQNSVVSGTSPSKSVRTKSTSTINSDAGSSVTAKMRSHAEKSSKRIMDQRVFIVWVERIEDMYTFPYEQLFEYTEDGSKHSSKKPDYVIIYLHLMEPELVRVHVDGIWTKHGQPGPLADGAVVSLSALPLLVKQTISSIAKRRCYEVDNFQLTSIKRKQAIQEFSKKYLLKQSYHDFLDSFIST